MLRAFVNENTARLRYFRMFVKLGSLTYVAICLLPRMAITCHNGRIFKDIFRPHTTVFACRRCAFLNPWTNRVNSFWECSWKRTSWRARWYAGCPWERLGCSWATMRVYFAREKQELTLNTLTSNRFSLFLIYPPRRHACALAEPLWVWTLVKALTRLLNLWRFRI
jgi:hypothetical protein